MARQPRQLHGQVALVTGAARGIGRRTAEALVRAGCRVAIGDLDVELAQRTAAEIGAGTIAFELNVADRASFAAAVESTERELGPIDVLVNNAGIMPLGRFVEEDEATQVRQFDVNVHGVLHGMKLVLPGMTARGRGHVVNVASMAGKAGFPGGATYCAAKHAVVGVSEAVRAELRDTGVEISVVMPAFVNTELISGLERGPLVKISEPEDVAAAIVDALRVPRFDVYVPKEAGVINRVLLPLPRRVREAAARALKADRLLLQVDAAQRAAYEARAAASDPAVPAGAEGPDTPGETQVVEGAAA